MAKRERPRPRSWGMADLKELGRQGQLYLKAIPVIILDIWVRKKGQPEANFVKTNELKTIIERALGVEFKPKASSALGSVLVRMQNIRNLTAPPLIECRMRGTYWINLPRYEALLQEYCRWYRQDYPAQYERLFPAGGPEEERPGLATERPEPGKVSPSETMISPQASRILQVQQELKSLQDEISHLSTRIGNVTEQVGSLPDIEAEEVSFVHTSPDFQGSAYGRKVTSIRDAIAGMLRRAEHSIRISTRQIDMFEDVLLALKRDSPHLEIVVLSRGPERAEGPRSRIAGRAFEVMKEAGINLPVEQDILHSRMVVIDEREVLVSSADLDYTQMEKEFNAGVWTNNPDVVAEAVSYFDNVLRSPTVKGARQDKGT